MKVLFLVVALAVASSQAGQISKSLRSRLNKGEILDVIIELPSVEDVFTSPALFVAKTKEAKVSTMVSMLKERTAASRQPFVKILKELGLSSQRSVAEPLWISNRFEVKNVDIHLAEVLARVSGDFLIREPKVARIIDPVQSREVSLAEVKQSEAQWGVAMIKAPEAWTVTKGANVIVGIIDTGVYLGHESLNASYAGAWLDPYYSRPEPNDVQSHGTHCMGSVLGTTNGVGVAPEAKWIACRGLNDAGSGYEADLLRCAQWMLAEATPRPHIVTNSWGGGANDPWYNEAMRAWIVADIIPVFALGNSGPSCGSANSPGDSNYAIGVGATTSTDGVASFSSRGPAVFQMKPEISAPGNEIISAGNTSPTSYTSKSGTSMATPHVAGLIALIRSNEPTLDYYGIKAKLQETADHPPVPPADITCSGGQEWPNTAFGHGRVNAATAVGASVASEKIYF